MTCTSLSSPCHLLDFSLFPHTTSLLHMVVTNIQQLAIMQCSAFIDIALSLGKEFIN